MITARLTALVFVVLFLQTGCATLTPTSPIHTETKEEEQAEEIAEGHISKLERIMILENEVGRLQERLSKLEEDMSNMVSVPATTATNNRRPSTSEHAKTQTQNPAPVANSPTAYQQALAAYQQKQYQSAIRLLNAYGQNYNTPAANFLMIQSHYQLQNCESVINLGRNFQRNVPKHGKAPDALMLAANCQYKMQQKDIARNTWRYIIQAYPNSVAAGQARVKLKT